MIVLLEFVDGPDVFLVEVDDGYFTALGYVNQN